MSEKYVEDEYEKEAVKLISQIKTINRKEQITLLEEAAAIIHKSANPESSEMHNFMIGMSRKLQGTAEKDHDKAIQLFDEALTSFSDSALQGKVNNEYHDAKIQKYKRELELNKGNFTKAAEIFLKIAEEQKILGCEEEYHIGKGMHHFLYSTAILRKDPYTALKEIDEALEEILKTSKTFLIPKIQATKLRILACLQPDPKARLALFNQSLEEIEKTDDKFGLDECKGQIYFLHAQMEGDWKGKVRFFKTAAKHFKKAEVVDSYNNSLGAVNFWKIHDTSVTIEEAIKLMTDSAHRYEIAGNVIDFERATGILFMLKSIFQGIMKNDDKYFTSNLAQANKHFAKSLPSRELNFTAGIYLFAEASKLPPEKAKDVLRKAAEILQIINEKFHHFVYYQYYLTEAYLAKEDVEAVLRYQQEGVLHLGEWLDSLRDFKKSDTRIELPFDSGTLRSLLRGDYYFLKGSLEKDPIIKESLFKQSICMYDELIGKGFMLDKVLHAKGWVYMFLDELDQAVCIFEEAYSLNPASKRLKDDRIFAIEQLKVGFRDLKESNIRESKFRLEFQEFIKRHFGDIGNLLCEKFVDQNSQNFMQQVLREIQKAGKALEENYPQHREKGEEGLRDELNQCLKMVCPVVSAESKIAKGKRDINIIGKFNQGELTAECLVWNGKAYYYEKKDQLFDRYLTWHNKEAALICFVRNSDFIQTINVARESIMELSDIESKSFIDLCCQDAKLFITEHKHKSGEVVRLYHIFFHLPKD